MVLLCIPFNVQTGILVNRVQILAKIGLILHQHPWGKGELLFPRLGQGLFSILVSRYEKIIGQLRPYKVLHVRVENPDKKNKTKRLSICLCHFGLLSCKEKVSSLKNRLTSFKTTSIYTSR